MAEFFHSFIVQLAWPWQLQPLWGMVIYAPLVILLGLWVFDRSAKAQKPERMIILTGSYVVLQLLAISYSRGVKGVGISLRYTDFYLLGILVNLCALLCLVVRLQQLACGQKMYKWLRVWHPYSLGRIWLPLLSAFYLALLLLGGMKYFVASLQEGQGIGTLSAWKNYAEIETEHLKKFVADGDEKHLNGEAKTKIGYPNWEYIARELRDPVVRRMLPPSIKRSLSVDEYQVSGAFVDPSLPEGYEDDGLCPDDWISSYAPEGGEGEFLSGVLEGDGALLRFFYAGYNATGSLKLRLLTPEKELIREVVFKRKNIPKRERGWRVLSVKSPKGPFRIQAVDARPNGWFAFGEFKKVGRIRLFFDKRPEFVQQMVFGLATLWVFMSLALAVASYLPPNKVG